jgi:hypothetical protein
VTVSLLDRGACVLFLFVMLPGCTVLGFVASCAELWRDWNLYGKPFDCVIVGY